VISPTCPALDRVGASGQGLRISEWHLQIIPRLTTPAGFEMGSGIYINVSFPEETAQFLREE
jgi:UDPglucose--hexose-1-phosphate uridylyltransferase